MILCSGNMWSQYGKTDLWLFTGNSYINQKGELVMGRGLALEVKTRFPTLPISLGGYIKVFGGGHLGNYGIVSWLILGEETRIGAFQVKHHFKESAELSLIGYSCIKLKEFIKQTHPQCVSMNFPGIGYGHLLRENVLPIIEELPDCVHIWEKGNKTRSRLARGGRNTTGG